MTKKEILEKLKKTYKHTTDRIFKNLSRRFLADAKKPFCGMSNVTVRPQDPWFMFWKTLARD